MFTLQSRDDGSTLSLAWESPDYWLAALTGPGLTAKRRVYAYAPLGDFRKLFSEMARDWRGWEGTKSWSSLEGELSVSCTSDGLGHVAILVELETQAYPESWRAAGTLVVEAGQLDGLARAAKNFVSVQGV